MKRNENEFNTQISDIAIKSILSALPKKRNFTERLLVEIVRRSISLGTRKYVENLRKMASRSTTERIRVPALSLVRQVPAFATDTVNREFTVYDRLPVMIAPHLEGACDLKLALCYALASTPDLPVHLLLVGEPATVKTELLEEARRAATKSVLIGSRATQAGLTMNLGNEYPGALARANNSLALIDELDKLSPQAIKSLHEAMESGRMTLNSGTLSREIDTKFTCIATANPKGDLLSPIKPIIRRQLLASVPAALLSRFHLAFLLQHPAGPQLERTVSKILTRTSRENPNLEFLRAYFETIKQMRPIIRCELDPTSSVVRKAQKFLSKKIKQSYSGELSAPLSVRTAESLKRLSMTSARMRLSPQVEELDITNAISIMKSSLATWI